ncbi:ABC transporter, ATP-binding protein [Labilithrix luteola]|uniref:ABC transporter, ATP-binding protein n=1 Tax=Labilithrix luteola TaxID=1391654 RepID=A0A0K1PL61_9BACT|nr:ATP-binding cassette domain-containing protein [Labilithrix luteola]AKU94255.1 ABC transporter, ATP-binding protein [Labilithrix luteola]
MIVLQGVSARGEARRRMPVPMLKNVSLTWERGVLAVVGSVADGTALLLRTIAGADKVQSGRLEVLAQPPSEVQPRIAYVPQDVVLPDALRVEEVCALSAALREEPPRPARERLAVLGLESLASRKTSSLSPVEARAVALALAVTSIAPVVLVEEPLWGLSPVAPARVTNALRARAAQGACVVVTTASVRDATRLGDQLVLLTQGVLTPCRPGSRMPGRAWRACGWWCRRVRARASRSSPRCCEPIRRSPPSKPHPSRRPVPRWCWCPVPSFSPWPRA